MSNLELLLPPGKTREALERKPKLKEKIKDPENQARLVDVQIQVQEAFIENPELSLESFNDLIKHLPLTQRRAFGAVFREIRKKQKVVKDILSNPENYTNGELDPNKVWMAIVYYNPENDPKKIPRPGEITIIPDPRFLRFRLNRNEIASEYFSGLIAIIPFTSIDDLDGFVVIEGKDTDISEHMLVHEFEHVLQKIVLKHTQKEEETMCELLDYFMKDKYLEQFCWPINADKEQNFYSQDYKFKPKQIEILKSILDECVRRVLAITIRNEIAAHLAQNYEIEAVIYMVENPHYTRQFKSNFHIKEEELSKINRIYDLETNNPAEAANAEKLKRLYHKVLEEHLDKRIPEIIESYRQEVVNLRMQGRDPKWIAVWLRNKALDPDSLGPLGSETERKSNLVTVCLNYAAGLLKNLKI